MNGQPGPLTLELREAVRARRDHVFTALTDPDALAAWWGPAGFTTPEIELDLRVGGHYRFTMQPPDGEPFHLAGDFLEISPPARLVYTFRWEEPDEDDVETVVQLSLEDDRDATQLSLSQGRFTTEQRLALHTQGWSESIKKLRDFLDSHP
jgi:uncharacterized protein YndB with AHSA1/START domain